MWFEKLCFLIDGRRSFFDAATFFICEFVIGNSILRMLRNDYSE